MRCACVCVHACVCLCVCMSQKCESSFFTLRGWWLSCLGGELQYLPPAMKQTFCATVIVSYKVKWKWCFSISGRPVFRTFLLMVSGVWGTKKRWQSGDDRQQWSDSFVFDKLLASWDITINRTDRQMTLAFKAWKLFKFYYFNYISCIHLQWC